MVLPFKLEFGGVTVTLPCRPINDMRQLSSMRLRGGADVVEKVRLQAVCASGQ